MANLGADQGFSLGACDAVFAFLLSHSSRCRLVSAQIFSPSRSGSSSSSGISPQPAEQLVAHLAKGFGKDRLDFVLADLGDESVALGRGLELIDGLVQIEFAGLPEQRPGLGAGDEDLERARPGGRVSARLLAGRRRSCAPPLPLSARLAAAPLLPPAGC